ncbi:MAG: hypothetical protein P8Q14_09315, partial [Vicingaceae bacterium]|nr:hypothetical protein [Vicingaceae bacterium]
SMKLFFLLIPIAFLSCKSTEESNITKNNIEKEVITSLTKDQVHNVEISIKTKEPYCGGAFPRDEDLNKTSTAATEYLIIDTNKKISTISSGADGMIYLMLKPGAYEIREMYKNMPFEEFKKNNQPKVNQALLNTDTDCFKEWWSENLLQFEVKATETNSQFSATINKMCRTGFNPCITFTGELPK